MERERENEREMEHAFEEIQLYESQEDGRLQLSQVWAHV